MVHQSLICLLIICALSTSIDASKKDFDIKGFLQRVVTSNLVSESEFKIGEINTGGCKDDYSWCNLYQNYCYHSTVKTFCKKTCNTCPTTPPPTDCQDKANCFNIKRYCDSNLYKGYMTKYCSVTCGFCGQENIGCGVAKRRNDKRTNIIVGGKAATKSFYPWQAAIYYDDEFLCGGSLVDNQHIVTAAHCFKHLSTDLSLYRVVLGDHNRDSDEGTEEERGVKKIVQHELYETNADTHDIAIMKLDRSVVFGTDINAICLPKENEVLQAGTKCFLSGWGKIRNDGDSVALLQHVSLPIGDRRHCQQRNTFNNHVINDRMICAGYNDGLHYSSGCHGDSGGPLSCEQVDGSWKLYGVVSWGSPQCNGLDRYTVFTRVSKYITWIKKHTS